MLTPEQRAALEASARAEMWRRGDLSFKRFAHQQAVYDRVKALDAREYFELWTRRGAKSGGGVLDSAEVCIKGGLALTLAPTAKQAAEITGDIAGKLLRDCPADIRPEYQKGEKEFRFPSGGIWRIKGVNGETYENLRGGEYDLITLDECAQYDELEEIIFGVVMPMTLTTRGLIRYKTTPPTSPAHYSVKLYQRLAEQGLASVITLADVAHIPFEEKCRMLLANGEDPDKVADIATGKSPPTSNYVKREYFCQFVVDRDLAVVPEFADHKADIVVGDEYQRPPFFDAYGAADMGMRDRTGLLVGYFDFMNQVFVVEDEALLDRQHTAAVAATWSSLEARHAYDGDRRRGGHVFMRVVDDPSLRVSADLGALGLQAQPVQKAGREAAIASMRVAITAGRLRIHSRCVNLIRQLETAVYKKSNSGKQYDFERDQDGHFDLVDALVYLLRSVIWTRNPYPPGWSPRDLHNQDVRAWRPQVRHVSSLNQSVFGGTPAGRRLLRGRR